MILYVAVYVYRKTQDLFQLVTGNSVNIYNILLSDIIIVISSFNQKKFTEYINQNLYLSFTNSHTAFHRDSVCSGMVVVLADFCGAYGYLGASTALHNALVRRVMRSPLQFFDETPVGRLVNRLGKDVDVMDLQLPATCRVFVWCGLGVAFTLAVVCYSTPIFSAAVLPLFVLYFIVQVDDAGRLCVVCVCVFIHI